MTDEKITLDPGESPQDLFVHKAPDGSRCEGKIAAQEGSPEDKKFLDEQRKELLRRLGVSPDAEPILTIPFKK